MKSMLRFCTLLFVAGLATLALNYSAVGAEIFVSSSQVGGFYGPYLPTDDPPTSYPAVPTPDNDPTFQNYFMGRTTVSGFTTSERRVFFFFDMTGIATTIPAGEEIVGASIDLELLPGGTSVLANFSGGFEVVEFSSTTATVDEILDPDGEGVAPEDVWDTFGTGTPYGDFEIVGPSEPSPTVPDTYTIPLPGSLLDLADAVVASSTFIVTARLVTYDPDPIGMGASPIDPYEYVFGGTDVVTPSGPGLAPPDLIITTAVVPEPSTSVMAIMGLFGVFIARRWRRG